MKTLVSLINKLTENSLINSIFFLLTFLNTTYLLFSRLFDNPKLKSKPVSKYGNHMIWTIFPDEDSKYGNMRSYAFIPYMKVYNIGKKPVELDEWTLLIKDKLTKNYIELDILPIPIAIQYLKDGSSIKYNVLGINYNTGPIQPGSSMNGLSLYVSRYYLNTSIHQNGEAIIIDNNNSVKGIFKVKDMFGKTSTTNVTFKYQSYEEVQKVMPNIHESVYKES